MENEILQMWSEQGTFAQTLQATHDKPRWTFYEGPPTANGTPGTHHVEARVFKDVFPRFKTMQGFHVERKAGWDCHGLPVEIAVEKELGLGGKPDIEAYGIAEFNAKCRESVLRNVDAFEQMTDRMGYWVDLDQAYQTMDPRYVESVWWSLKQIFDKGLLAEDHRITPYCPRCGTGLSDHELAQGYEEVEDSSVYVRFRLTSGPHQGADLLVWTTTPWTLVSNTAVAVNPQVTYLVMSKDDDTVIVAEPLAEAVLGEGWTTKARIIGTEMEHWRYQRPFELIEFSSDAHFVMLADYVTIEDGTGLVHLSPAFGEEDLKVCRAYGVEVLNPVTTDGHFEEGISLVGGTFFKEADPVLVADLDSRGILFRHLPYVHSYPHCWRCHTPLMYYAMPAWYIRTTAKKEALLEQNEQTNWVPSTIQWGRYGDWLRNNIDWSLSRSRYWGTPLPIWRNDENPADVICVGSLAELSELSGHDLSNLDPHRPFVDDITFTLENKSGVYRRVPDVIDAWYDSGSMPFAQWGYPYVDGSVERFEQAYPAQYICEAIDQTRGWFYSLMAVGTLVFDRSSYENVVCLGHILAEDGRKMSKHLGNILLPMPLMDEHGADALRWFMACSGSPWSARRIGHTVLSEIVRKVLLTYWNTVAFHSLYARSSQWSPTDTPPAVQDRHILDRWLVSETQILTQKVTEALERFDTQAAGQAMASFIDDLSNWYVRRSRRRFWRGEAAALATLHETLSVLTRLMAPLVPFITERVWQDLFASSDSTAPGSVHLSSWPVADSTLIDAELNTRVGIARRITELGRAARAEAKVRTRQPLRRALIGSSAYELLGEELIADIKAELNIASVESFAADADLVDISAKGNFKSLGKKHGQATPLVAAAIAQADGAVLSRALKETGQTEILVDGSTVVLDAEDVIVTERPREGWSVVNEQGETVALDLELDAELIRAGLAREAVRLIQEARKASGFEVSDRIRVRYAAGDDMARAMAEHSSSIADEVLAVEMIISATATGFVDNEFSLRFDLEKV